MRRPRSCLPRGNARVRLRRLDLPAAVRARARLRFRRSLSTMMPPMHTAALTPMRSPAPRNMPTPSAGTMSASGLPAALGRR